MTCCMSKKMRVLLLEVWQKDAVWLWGQTVALCKASVAMAIAMATLCKALFDVLYLLIIQ